MKKTRGKIANTRMGSSDRIGDRHIERKSALVTGTSSGIGRATALHLAGRGWTVFASVRKETDAEALRGLGQEDLIPICPLDLARPDEIAGAADRILEEIAERRLPGLSGIVNSAGGGGVAPLELLRPADLLRELTTRLVGPLDLLQRLLPALREGSGRLVWIVTPALVPIPFVGSIHVPDFAVNCLIRTLSMELGERAVPQVMIRCGGIQTESVARSHAELAADLERWPSEGLERYRERLLANERELERFDLRRSAPSAVAEKVLAALTARRPRRRYSIGHLARAAGVLEALPAALADRVISAR